MSRQAESATTGKAGERGETAFQAQVDSAALAQLHANARWSLKGQNRLCPRSRWRSRSVA